MNIPTYKDGQIVGNYEFDMSSEVYQGTHTPPHKIVTFCWSPEWIQLNIWEDPNKIYELFGERLKQDFISFLKQKHAGQR